MSHARVTGLGLCLAAQLVTHAALADGAVALVWHGGPGTESCAKAEELQRAAEVQLERQVFVAPGSPARLTLVVEVERREEPRGFHATVRVEAEDGRDPGTRELDVSGDDCRALDEPLALVVALMADTELSRPLEPAEPEPEPPEPPEPRPPVVHDDERDLAPIETGPAPSPPAPWRAELGASIVGAYAVLPAPSIGGDLALVVAPGSFPEVMLHGAAFLPREEPLPADTAVRFLFAYGGVSLCPELASSERALLRGCIGPAVGALRAESRGLTNGRDTTRLVIASEIGLRGRFELGRGVLATAALSFLLPLRPETFTYKSDGQSENIFQMGHLAIAASVGGAYEIR